MCEQQRRRSACASVQSDQHLCCSLPRQNNISSFYIGNFMNLVADRFESYLVRNPKDRFSRDEAHVRQAKLRLWVVSCCFFSPVLPFSPQVTIVYIKMSEVILKDSTTQIKTIKTFKASFYSAHLVTSSVSLTKCMYHTCAKF